MLMLQVAIREAGEVAAAAAVNSSGIAVGSALLADALTAARAAVDMGRAVAAMRAALATSHGVESLAALRSAVAQATASGADAADAETFRCALTTGHSCTSQRLLKK